MNNQYFIFTDIDGTLYDHGNNRIPVSSKEALIKAKANGHKIFICSGRCYSDIDPFYFELPIDGFVVGGGAHVILNDHQEYFTPMPLQELDYLKDYLMKHDIGFALEGVHKIFLYGEAHEIYRYFLSATGLYPNLDDTTFNKILTNRNTYPVHEMSKTDYQETLKFSFYSKKKKELEELLSRLPDTVVGYFDNMSDMMTTGEFYMKNTSKATGMDIVLKAYDHPLERTIALGDNMNDLEMIMHAGIGIAMGNACDELKRKADFVTKHISDDGFAYALEKFKLI